MGRRGNRPIERVAAGGVSAAERESSCSAAAAAARARSATSTTMGLVPRPLPRSAALARKGENISAREVEDLLATHRAVAEVAVVAVPDAVGR